MIRHRNVCTLDAQPRFPFHGAAALNATQRREGETTNKLNTMRRDIIITGRRPNGEVRYFCEGSNGGFWCENAQEIARGFDSEEEAMEKQESLSKIYLGLQLEQYPRYKHN